MKKFIKGKMIGTPKNLDNFIMFFTLYYVLSIVLSGSVISPAQYSNKWSRYLLHLLPQRKLQDQRKVRSLTIVPLILL